MTDAITLTRPDQPGLRQRRSRRRPRQARNIALSAAGRRFRLELMRWALATGHSLDADAAAAAVGALCARGAPIGALTDDVISDLLWIDILAWCRAHQVDTPTRVPATLHALVDFLAETERLAPSADHPSDLHATIDAVGGTAVGAGPPSPLGA